MKTAKAFLIIGFLSLGYAASAQRAEVGLSGGYATTWMLNKNVFDCGPEVDPVISGGGNFGLAATFYFTEKVGLGIELNNSVINQKYKGVIGGVSYDTKTKMTFLDIPLLLKLKSGKSGFYFEIGPKLSYTLAATETSGSGVSTLYLGGGNVKSDFNSALIAGVLGIGGRINIVDALTLSLGLRLSGTISDATQEFDGSGGLGNSGFSSYQANTADDKTINYARTTIAAAGIQVGLLYRIGK